jgi:hypothetical protein
MKVAGNRFENKPKPNPDILYAEKSRTHARNCDSYIRNCDSDAEFSTLG